MAEANASILPATRDVAQLQGRLAQLSLQGLWHAQALGAESVEVTAGRLYTWNRLPLSAWRRLAAEPAFVSTKSVGAAGSVWTQVMPGPPASPWCVWRLRGDPVEHTGPGWKLYVSPHPLQLAEAVVASLDAAAGLPVVSLKYGGDAYGILTARQARRASCVRGCGAAPCRPPAALARRLPRARGAVHGGAWGRRTDLLGLRSACRLLRRPHWAELANLGDATSC